MGYPACPKCGCNDHDLDIYKCHACNVFFCIHCGGGTGLLSLTPNCDVCRSNYRVNRYSKVENPLVVQQRYNEDNERKRIVLEEYLPQSSSSGSGSDGGSTSSTGGFIYFGLGILFLAWLYFTNKSQVPLQTPSLQGTTTQTTNTDNTINQFTLSVDKIKSDLVGTDVGGITIQSSNDLNSFDIVDSLKSNDRLGYIATFELHKQTEQFSRHHFRATINYRNLNGNWTFLNAQSALVADTVDIRDSNEVVAPTDNTSFATPISTNVTTSYNPEVNRHPIEDSMLNPDAPIIQWETQNIDYGKVIKGDDNNATRYFKFKNVGKTPLIISSCHGNCGCVVPSCPTETIIPGKGGTINVHYDVNRIGNFTKTVTVVSNAQKSNVVLQITGVVE